MLAKNKICKLWLCLPFVLAFLVDAAVTLQGQPACYWQGNRAMADEGFPLFLWSLHMGPWAFLLLCLVWVLVFSVLIIVLPDLCSEILGIALVNGHTFGAMTWFVYHLQLNFYLCLIYFAIIATVFALSHRQWLQRDKSYR